MLWAPEKTCTLISMCMKRDGRLDGRFICINIGRRDELQIYIYKDEQTVSVSVLRRNFLWLATNLTLYTYLFFTIVVVVVMRRTHAIVWTKPKRKKEQNSKTLCDCVVILIPKTTNNHAFFVFVIGQCNNILWIAMRFNCAHSRMSQ